MYALELLDRTGLAFTSRWLHIIAGVAWIGLLYYFNFVQVPSFAQIEAAARTEAIDNLRPQALWWFRWATVATVVTGTPAHPGRLRRQDPASTPTTCKTAERHRASRRAC